jgi:hypothetical protein
MYSDLERDILASLRADPSLAGVKTFSEELRECLFTGDKLTQGFRPEELPAIRVTAQEKPSTSAPFSVGEIAYTIPVTALVITRGGTKQEAHERALAMQEPLLANFQCMRKSGNGLGENTFLIGEISTTSLVIEEKPVHFAVAQIEAQFLKVVQL